MKDADAALVEQLWHAQKRGRLYWYEPTAAASNMIPGDVAEPTPPDLGLTSPSGSAVLLDGVSGSFVSAGSGTSMQVTGDLELGFVGKANQWANGTQALVGKNDSGDTSYVLQLNGLGHAALGLSDGGGAAQFVTSGVAVPFADLVRGGVVVTWRQSDGRVQFWTLDNPTDPENSTRTQLGTDQTIAIASIFASSTPAEVGAINMGTARLFAGEVEWAQVRDGIGGTVVGEPDFRGLTVGDVGMTDAQGNVWTLQGGAAVVDVGRVSIDGRVWDIVTGAVATDVPTVEGVGYTVQVRASEATDLMVTRLGVSKAQAGVVASDSGTGLLSATWTAGAEAGVRVAADGSWSGLQMFETAKDPGGWMPGRGIPQVLLTGMSERLLWALASGDVLWEGASVTLLEVDG